MKQIDETVKLHVDGYKKKLIREIEKIEDNVFRQVIDVLRGAEREKSTVYVMGNGGSAATASHMVNDIGVGLRRRGILNINIISLSDCAPAITAAANDIGYENIFISQIEGLLKKEDVVIAISCSGNSPNITKAVEYAKEIGTTVVGLTGFDGGFLKKKSDINYHIDTETGEYGLVEDLHMIFDHLLYSYFIDRKKI